MDNAILESLSILGEVHVHVNWVETCPKQTAVALWGEGGVKRLASVKCVQGMELVGPLLVGVF